MKNNKMPAGQNVYSPYPLIVINDNEPLQQGT
jgi:hypothetical protein